MKIKLIIEEHSAQLLAEGENDFERAMLEKLEKLPQHHVSIVSEKNWGTVTYGHISLVFSTKKEFQV